jgi:hypothetical protein
MGVLKFVLMIGIYESIADFYALVRRRVSDLSYPFVGGERGFKPGCFSDRGHCALLQRGGLPGRSAPGNALPACCMPVVCNVNTREAV